MSSVLLTDLLAKLSWGDCSSSRDGLAQASPHDSTAILRTALHPLPLKWGAADGNRQNNEDSLVMPIYGITQDSRLVRAGWIFAAIHGTAHNGEDYIDAAIRSGACAVLCRPEAADLVPEGVIALITDAPRCVLSVIASAFYQPQPAHMVAITGTDGKTSTAEFTRQLWERMGYAALSIGTLGLKTDHTLQDMPVLSDNTTPEPVSFYHALSCAMQQGIDYAVCEASSHGIEQCRLEGITPNVAVFTSFSQDHLDYHHTMEAYFDAKAGLFERLLATDGLSVLCSDYPHIISLAERLRAAGKRVMTYGREGDVAITSITPTLQGQEVDIIYSPHDSASDHSDPRFIRSSSRREHYSLTLPIFGVFQVYNVIAAALAVSFTTNTPMRDVLKHVPYLTTIRGRLELVGKTADGALIFVDYAHTAGALEKALETLRAYAPHHLHVVFGCGGDRDATKRSHMGKVATRLADYVIITDDNPRTEDAALIRRAVMAGCVDALEIADRAEAICVAIGALRAGDVLLIAGKGHENYQILGTTKHHFDDAEMVATCFTQIKGH